MKKAGEALPEDLKTSPEEQLVERLTIAAFNSVCVFPGLKSRPGAPNFVLIDALRKVPAGPSTFSATLRSLRMTMVNLGSCFPTLAKLGWGTHI